MQYITVGDGNKVSRITKGCWQMSAGHGAGAIGNAAIEELLAFYDAGITTFDGGDIYTGVEELFGRFRKECLRERGQEALSRLRFHTKFVPDLEALPRMNRQYVERIVDRSLKRIGVECLDLVQFHWWDFDIPGHVETAHHLAALQKAGKIKNIGVTNYDVAHLRELVESDVPVVSNQIQWSLVDRRVYNGMYAYCRNLGIKMLAYGVLAGGFLSDYYIMRYGWKEPLTNRSLQKYKLIIEETGDWQHFHFLLFALLPYAQEFLYGQGIHVDIAAIASAIILQEGADAIILGGGKHRIKDMEVAAELKFGGEGTHLWEKFLSNAHGPRGDIYELERQKGGKHAAIMKYNLNNV